MDQKPTYGKLIEILEDAKVEAASNEIPVAELLSAKFSSEYPHIPISRPSRFLDTVRRIAAPTVPRVRNTHSSSVANIK